MQIFADCSAPVVTFSQHILFKGQIVCHCPRKGRSIDTLYRGDSRKPVSQGRVIDDKFMYSFWVNHGHPLQIDDSESDTQASFRDHKEIGPSVNELSTPLVLVMFFLTFPDHPLSIERLKSVA